MTQTICNLQSLDLTEHLLTPNLQHTEESTDKLLQPIKLIQGCQKQKDELEKKKQKQMIELTRKERIWTQLENVIWKEAHFNREKTMK